MIQINWENVGSVYVCVYRTEAVIWWLVNLALGLIKPLNGCLMQGAGSV